MSTTRQSSSASGVPTRSPGRIARLDAETSPRFTCPRSSWAPAGLRSAHRAQSADRSAAAAEDPQQRQEEVDEVEVEGERAEDRELARRALVAEALRADL